METINHERLKATLKTIVKASRKFIENIKKLAAAFKRWCDSLLKKPDVIVAKLFPSIKHTRGKQFKSYVLPNKPKTIHARTNC